MKKQEEKVISEATSNEHQKHAKLARPDLGEFGRNELAIIGTSCANIKVLAAKIISMLSRRVAYVDADHTTEKNEEGNSALGSVGTSLEYTDKITFKRIDFTSSANVFRRRMLFNEEDLILVNGNHFTAKNQIVVIDPIKNLEKKIDTLTDVVLILLKKDTTIPDILKTLPHFKNIPVLPLEDEMGIATFITDFLSSHTSPLFGLVLSGGESSRMKNDKGNLKYHGVSQRQHVYNLLSTFCKKSFVSCNARQVTTIDGGLPVIQDSFLQLGPLGGILSAFQSEPNAAWLAVACDLPYLSTTTIEYLTRNRNPSKMATAFLDPTGEFPEPLVTIWEPKSYSILLQFLSQGYSCPRKFLINGDIELLKAPDKLELTNANFPEEYQHALTQLQNKPN